MTSGIILGSRNDTGDTVLHKLIEMPDVLGVKQKLCDAYYKSTVVSNGGPKIGVQQAFDKNPFEQTTPIGMACQNGELEVVNCMLTNINTDPDPELNGMFSFNELLHSTRWVISHSGTHKDVLGLEEVNKAISGQANIDANKSNGLEDCLKLLKEMQHVNESQQQDDFTYFIDIEGSRGVVTLSEFTDDDDADQVNIADGKKLQFFDYVFKIQDVVNGVITVTEKKDPCVTVAGTVLSDGTLELKVYWQLGGQNTSAGAKNYGSDNNVGSINVYFDKLLDLEGSMQRVPMHDDDVKVPMHDDPILEY